MFVLDISIGDGASSLKTHVLDFMIQFVKQFTIGQNAVQFGLVTASRIGYNVFYLNTYFESIFSYSYCILEREGVRQK